MQRKPGEWLLGDGSYVGLRYSTQSGWTLDYSLANDAWKVHING